MTPNLDSIRIASPCSADWNSMQGDERRRFCADCKLHVHDISAMSRDEALDLLRQAGQGRLCVRLHRRSDGTVLTQDCPVGLRRRLRWAWARAVAAASVLLSAIGCARKQETMDMGKPEPVEVQPAKVDPEPVRMGLMAVEMGDMVEMGEGVEQGRFIPPLSLDPPKPPEQSEQPPR
jgi:hypothetical protein